MWRTIANLIAGTGVFHILTIILPALAEPPPPIIAGTARALPVQARNGMVVAQESRAARAGLDILKRGGNAVDAAVATGFALAVTLPRAGNLGGGGFMVVHLGAKGGGNGGRDHALNYREAAPDDTPPTVFLDDRGVADPSKSRDSGLGIGIPGTVAGLTYAHTHWGSGSFTLAQLLEPAIMMAREGIIIDEDLADSLPGARARLARWPASRAIFAKPDGAWLGAGDRLVQRDLADTLQKIADHGPDGFYKGETAEKIAAAVQSAGGRMSVQDIAGYRAIPLPALRGTYRGREIIGMPLPSLGGPLLLEMLSILEATAFHRTAAQSAASIHLMTEAMKLAFADRARWLSEPVLSQATLDAHLTKPYAAGIAAHISPDHTLSADKVPGLLQPRRSAPHPEGDQTTHFSVTDKDGNAVSNTYTLNFSYGLGLVAAGTGVLLNNELDDFSASPDARNAFGLTGGGANAPGPGKRPLSSMAPTIILRDGTPELITGTPGGPRIITTVLQIVTDILDYRMNAAEATIAPRFHHQWQPDELRIERGMSADTTALLRAKGQNVVERETMGSTATIHIVDGIMNGASDTRQRGTLAAGF